MDETYKLIKEFFIHNKSLVILTILSEMTHSILESIVVPLLLANAFNNIDNIVILKEQLIKLVLSWIVIKLAFSISLYYHNQLEPEISKFIMTSIIKSVFLKYENDNKITNLSEFLGKINLIKNNLHEFSYLICTIFIPRSIVLLLNCYNIYNVNKKLGVIVFISVILQLILLTRGLDNCIDVTMNEFKDKDFMYDYIEDIFSNINIIQSTQNGYDHELARLNEITDSVKKSEKDVTGCINKKQYFGYSTNIAIFSVCIYNIYKLHVDGEMDNKNVTTSILLLMGLFDNMCNMTYYIPNLTYKVGVLKANESFLKELMLKSHALGAAHALKKDFSISNPLIEFKNVSFSYGSNVIFKNFNIVIPENKIICIYGGIGQGKSTFVKLIFKTLLPSEGEILIGNQDISKYEVRDIRKYISYIDQSSSQLFNRTIFENIIYGQELNEQQKLETIEHIKNTITDFDLYYIFQNLDKDKPKWSFLNADAGKLGGNLSGGQKQIIHLIRTELNNYTRIVILDEPTSHLDSVTRDKVFALLRHINSKGKTVIIITHDKYCENIADKLLQFSSNANPVYTK